MKHTISVALCVIVSLVLGAIATRYVHPQWMLATLHSLQLHAAIACALAMILALLISRNVFPGLLLIASIGIAVHAWIMPYEFDADPAPQSGKTIRLMHFNILGGNYRNGERIYQAIVDSGADVVNIMEMPPLAPYLAELDKVYPYRIGCGRETEICDMMMLSKRPLTNLSVGGLSELRKDRFMLADIDVGGTTVHVAAMHLSKPYFDNYHKMEMTNAARILNNRKGPLLLSGDFNSSSIAPDVQQFMRWTGLRTIAPEIPTWPVRLGRFGIAIDHVMVRAPLGMKSVTRIPNSMGSNHYGLMAEFVVPE
ncbi:endonuclease [Rhizobiales bacterium RZME27]|uniref:Endonuclease n=1 Tax=Endobacterium cereale TaxID=2663029 RepID=A0A6A8AKI3_9HYPH|nr:endonuclease/exonuclease/phosphatase family protein [Endobacterium cereale]MEB2843060.1 endonuclease/exonuclease/phosphatase family protein [Endobacterium cereale]MQY49686.1 endonuclease [Endobacterium cereale]